MIRAAFGRYAVLSVVMMISGSTAAVAQVSWTSDYSIDSPIRDIVSNPEALAVVQKHLPGMFAKMPPAPAGGDGGGAGGLPFSFMLALRPGPEIPGDVLAKLDADLAKVPRKGPTPLTPEAKRDMLAAEIDDALDAKDEALALLKLRQLDAIDAARPTGTYLTEAKLARRAGDYPRARTALERYFNAVKPEDSAYGEATREKARIHSLSDQEVFAWSVAQVRNTCTSYASYLVSRAKWKKSTDFVIERMDAIGCAGKPGLPDSVNQALAALQPLKVPGYSAGQVIKDCPQCPEMVVIKGGFFTMGSPADEVAGVSRDIGGRQDNEGPQRRVGIKSFAAGKYEVTFDEWDACLAEGGCSGYSPPDNGWGKGKRPVIKVHTDDAAAYVRWLSAKTGKTYRLLTEAEWEYAARAGTTTPFWTGDSIAPAQANYDSHVGMTVPVGSYPPNAFGLYDTAGNVWEWVQDCTANDAYADAPTDGSAKIVPNCPTLRHRGGSWIDEPHFLRSAIRVASPREKILNMGFRVARTL